MLRRLFTLALALAALRDVRAQSCRSAACASLSAAALAAAHRDFDAIVRSACRLELQRRIAFVNSAINQRVSFASDADSLAHVDIWLTPLETLALGCGDCEDFAIAKFFVLLAGGTDPGELRLLYARRHDPVSSAAVRPHVVALVRHPCADPLVLDNVDAVARPISCRRDIDPVFSFDRAHLWAGVGGPDQGGAQRLRPWRELLERCAAQQVVA
jgi:predicted transglutaminase-like cysteine proteinase